MSEKSKKTLVIGSLGHSHVRCVPWEDAVGVNIADFDRAVINTASLTEELLLKLGGVHFSAIRKGLARLLASGGEVVALSAPHITAVKPKGHNPVSNYDWSPLPIGTNRESGDTLTVIQDDFPKYFVRIRRWDYYFFRPDAWLTQELVAECGHPTEYTYQVFELPLIQNRYLKALALTVAVQVIPTRAGQNPPRLLKFTALPLIQDLENRAAMNLILEDLIPLPQITLPPEWLEKVSMPLADAIDVEIDRRRREITMLEAEVADASQKKNDLLKFKKLLYASGSELELIFAEALERCGGTIKPAKYSQEEFVLQWENGNSLVECKGVGKSIALTHLRQLIDYTLKYEEDEGAAGKGILLGNAWKDTPLEMRGSADMPVFPQNVIDRAKANGVALINSVDFYYAFCRVLEGNLSGAALLNKITKSIGPVNLADI